MYQACNQGELEKSFSFMYNKLIKEYSNNLQCMLGVTDNDIKEEESQMFWIGFVLAEWGLFSYVFTDLNFYFVFFKPAKSGPITGIFQSTGIVKVHVNLFHWEKERWDLGSSKSELLLSDEAVGLDYIW